MSHVTYAHRVNESCHICTQCEWVMSHVHTVVPVEGMSAFSSEWVYLGGPHELVISYIHKICMNHVAYTHHSHGWQGTSTFSSWMSLFRRVFTAGLASLFRCRDSSPLCVWVCVCDDICVCHNTYIHCMWQNTHTYKYKHTYIHTCIM